MTAYLVMAAGVSSDEFLHHLAEELKEDFGIGHATLQVAMGTGAACALAPEHVV